MKMNSLVRLRFLHDLTCIKRKTWNNKKYDYSLEDVIKFELIQYFTLFNFKIRLKRIQHEIQDRVTADDGILMENMYRIYSPINNSTIIRYHKKTGGKNL